MQTNNHTTDLRGAADILKVHPKTMLEIIQSGAVPAAKVGRSYVMLTIDVLSYLEQLLIKQTADRMRGVTKERRPGRTRAGSRTS